MAESHLVDTHVHVWNRNLLSYPWLDALPDLRASRLPERYSAELAAEGGGAPGARLSCVFVQAGAADGEAVAEARWVQSLAPTWPALRGIVADADLADPRLASHLDALESLPLLVGVRHLLQDVPGEAIGSAGLRHGLEQLAARGLVFDACVRWWQLDLLGDALALVPDLMVVLDHVGKPPMSAPAGDSSWETWERGLRRLATLPNVHVKLSGLSAESSTAAEVGQHASRVLRVALDAFGSARAMLGSDWPVSAVGASGRSPASWFEVVRQGVPASAWADVSAGTADRVYRLGLNA